MLPPRTLLAGLACALGLALLLTLTPTGSVPAADPKAPAGDPKARQLLDDVAKAYKKLAGYADQGEFVLSATVNGKAESLRTPMALSFERPNKLKLDTGDVLLVSDGTTLTTAVVPFKKYTAAPAPKAVAFETFAQGPVGSILFGGPSAPPMFILLNLLVGDDPVNKIASLGGGLALEADREAGGATFKSLLIDQEQGPDIRLLIDPKSNLLKTVDLVFDAKEMAEKGLQDKVSIKRLGWSAGTVATKDLPDATFAYNPPKDFAKVESFSRAADEAKYPVNELVGKPAPDFALTVLDGEGKTKTLSKKDLAGKVVLIDFWATWCGPCMLELPEVQKLIESYNKDKKDVLVVALSQDDEPNDPKEVRKLVEKTLEEKHLKLNAAPVGLVGIDPAHDVGDAFQVNAYPTVVLLDAKGVVQGAHVGIPKGEVGAVVPALSQAIDALLQGKPLAPKPEEAAADGAQKVKP